MEGTKQAALQIGYTSEQAKLLSDLDDLFEKAIELKLLSEEQVTELGQLCGLMTANFTGKVI